MNIKCKTKNLKTCDSVLWQTKFVT